jgi:hypothetical protein
MAKLVLEEVYDFDFWLIGISCHSKIHRLAWALNKALDWDLERQDDIELTKKGTDSTFPWMSFIDDENFKEFHLLANRSGNGYLIPEQKQVDFFLEIIGDFNEEQQEYIKIQLKYINEVLMSFEIDPLSLKSRNNLLI